MKIKRNDIGSIVRNIVDQKGLSKAEFAKRVGIARQNIEKTVFQKSSLDTDLLCRISEVLECNLFNYYSSDESSNIEYYNAMKEVKATLSIEMGAEKKEQVFRFIFGENNIEILNK